MVRMLKKTAIFGLALVFFLASSGPILAAEDIYGDEGPVYTDHFIDHDLSGEAMVADALLVRPLGIVATLVGTTVFVVSLPFSLAGGNSKAAFQELMAEPAGFTFTRPLGFFRH